MRSDLQNFQFIKYRMDSVMTGAISFSFLFHAGIAGATLESNHLRINVVPGKAAKTFRHAPLFFDDEFLALFRTDADMMAVIDNF